mmetsp:Transcript_12264/g.29122  ORF Transcript_12264/g.29122 Transcript_12264/m.29122 type:complete len:309 (+) Transcript_12264:2950-3876(+)
MYWCFFVEISPWSFAVGSVASFVFVGNDDGWSLIIHEFLFEDQRSAAVVPSPADLSPAMRTKSPYKNRVAPSSSGTATSAGLPFKTSTASCTIAFANTSVVTEWNFVGSTGSKTAWILKSVQSSQPYRMSFVMMFDGWKKRMWGWPAVTAASAAAALALEIIVCSFNPMTRKTPTTRGHHPIGDPVGVSSSALKGTGSRSESGDVNAVMTVDPVLPHSLAIDPAMVTSMECQSRRSDRWGKPAPTAMKQATGAPSPAMLFISFSFRSTSSRFGISTRTTSGRSAGDAGRRSSTLGGKARRPTRISLVK